jgi:hypothetical protein
VKYRNFEGSPLGRHDALPILKGLGFVLFHLATLVAISRVKHVFL